MPSESRWRRRYPSPKRLNMVDGDVLVASVAMLVRSAGGGFTVEDILRGLGQVASEVMDVAGAGVLMVEEDGMRLVATVGSDIGHVEEAQHLSRRGAGQAAQSTQREVLVEDLLAHKQDWPEFSAAAMAAGLGSVLAVPLMSRSQVWGVLDLYHQTEHHWSASELAAARFLSEVAMSCIVMKTHRSAAAYLQQELTHRSMHDELTGLPGRVLVFDRLTQALAAASREGSSIAVLFIDLDRFKQVNENFGYEAGDVVLRTVSDRMNATLRDEDTLCRLASDEFIVICERLPQDTPSQLDHEVSRMVERVHRAISLPIRIKNTDIEVHASIGAAISSNDPTNDDLLGDADAAMYDAKQNHQANFVLRKRVTGGDQRRHRRDLERDLTHALQRDELRLHYQPIVDADTRTVTAVEALLRWEHPDEGLLSAATFIDLAESGGVVAPIGRWVIDQACAQIADWQRQLGAAAPKTCYINLSPRELTHPDLDEAIIGSIDHHHLDAHNLGLEIVEAAFVDSQLLPALIRHQRRGHPLSIDDFGTGYSSLSRLIDLPVSIAKIDQSFVTHLTNDTRRQALVAAVIVVAQHLDLRVIGEGVESEDQAQYLDRVGCHFLQGFHTGRPQPGDQLAALWSHQ